MSKETPSSFRTWKINRTTFAVREDDAFHEYPLIYVKLHQRAPILLLSDTGTGEAKDKNGKGECRAVDGERSEGRCISARTGCMQRVDFHLTLH